MLNKFGHVTLASLLGTSMLILPTEVSAFSIPAAQREAPVQINASQDSLYQNVRLRRYVSPRQAYLYRRHHRYYPHYRYRYGPYRYYHRGYWYDTPWWLVTIPFAGAAGAAIAVTPGYYGGYGGSAHVRWCANHYRSYNPRTNTWVGNSGRVYQCNSPYDGR